MYLLVFESEICKFHETHLISGNIFFHFRALLDTPPIPGGVKQLMMPSNARSLKKIWLLKQFVVFGMDMKSFEFLLSILKCQKKVQMSTSYELSKITVSGYILGSNSEISNV